MLLLETASVNGMERTWSDEMFMARASTPAEMPNVVLATSCPIFFIARNEFTEIDGSYPIAGSLESRARISSRVVFFISASIAIMADGAMMAG